MILYTSPSLSLSSPPFLIFLIVLSTNIINGLLYAFVFDKMIAKKLKKEKHIDTINKYAGPILDTSISLLYRLNDIFSYRDAFLKKSTVKNEFNVYKFRSTIYRLCALLGWIRGFKIEHSYFEVLEKNESLKIENTLNSLLNVLSSGQHFEKIKLEDFCNELSLDISKMKAIEIKELAIDFEGLIHEYNDSFKNQDLERVNPIRQFDLIKELCSLITSTSKVKIPIDAVIKGKQKAIIQILMKTEKWIYRDWLFAIGDFMLKPIDNTTRRFDIKSYSEFMSYYGEYAKTEDIPDPWIRRVVELFEDLDMSLDSRHDARINQVKGLFNKTIDVLEEITISDHLVAIWNEHKSKFEKINK